MWQRHLPALFLILGVASIAAAGGMDPSFGYDTWREAVAERGVDPDGAVYPFRVSPEMQAWAEEVIRGKTNQEASSQLDALQEALFSKKAIVFEYDEALTLTAAEAFATSRGNCMSFTALFIALSRSIGIPASLVSVRRPAGVAKDNGLVVVNRHVVAGHRTAGGLLLYDFYVTSTSPYVKQRIIDDLQASAMYHTNLGGSAIRLEELDAAVHHLEIATKLSPQWSAGWVNLGVARFRRGESAAALEAYSRALEVNPDDPSALTNLAYVYHEMGLEQESRSALRAAAEGTNNPFTLIAMADMEMARGNFDKAQKYLRRAKWWYSDEPEIYDALARLAHHRGDPRKAMRHAHKAARLRSTVNYDR